jgi:transcriptional regulator with XRE-family HTH domain
MNNAPDLIFAKAVRAAREAQNLSLAELEAKSGVSRAMLSKVERGEKSPTLPVACRIAQGLQISMSRLLGADPKPAPITVTRLDKRTWFCDEETGFVRELLSPAIETFGFEAVRHILPAGGSSGDLPAYRDGFQKLVIVENGTLCVRLAETEIDLAIGDTLCFEPDQTHVFSNRGSEKSSYLVFTTLRSALAL